MNPRGLRRSRTTSSAPPVPVLRVRSTGGVPGTRVTVSRAPLSGPAVRSGPSAPAPTARSPGAPRHPASGSSAGPPWRREPRTPGAEEASEETRVSFRPDERVGRRECRTTPRQWSGRTGDRPASTVAGSAADDRARTVRPHVTAPGTCRGRSPRHRHHDHRSGTETAAMNIPLPLSSTPPKRRWNCRGPHRKGTGRNSEEMTERPMSIIVSDTGHLPPAAGPEPPHGSPGTAGPHARGPAERSHPASRPTGPPARYTTGDQQQHDRSRHEGPRDAPGAAGSPDVGTGPASGVGDRRDPAGGGREPHSGAAHLRWARSRTRARDRFL